MQDSQLGINCKFHDSILRMTKDDFAQLNVRTFLDCLATAHGKNVADLNAHEDLKLDFPYGDESISLTLENYLILFLWLEASSQLVDINDLALLDAALEFLKARAQISSNHRVVVGTKRFKTENHDQSPTLANLEVWRTKRTRYGSKDNFTQTPVFTRPWTEDIPLLAQAIFQLSLTAHKDITNWNMPTLDQALSNPISIKIGSRKEEYELQGRFRRTLRWLSIANHGHYPLDSLEQEKALRYWLSTLAQWPEALIKLGSIPNNQGVPSFDLATILINRPYEAKELKEKILKAFAQAGNVPVHHLRLAKHGHLSVPLAHLGGSMFGQMTLIEYMRRYYQWLGARHRLDQILKGTSPHRTQALTIETDQKELDKLTHSVSKS